jgi:hypothetical protein
MTAERRIRARAAIALALVVPLGFALKTYSGPLEWLIRNWGASICYEIFFMLFAFLFFPRRRAILPIAVCVCLATIALEFLQLWHPPFLEAVRATFIGQALIGNTFVWTDLPIYPVACALGWVLLRGISVRGNQSGA